MRHTHKGNNAHTHTKATMHTHIHTRTHTHAHTKKNAQQHRRPWLVWRLQTPPFAQMHRSPAPPLPLALTPAWRPTLCRCQMRAQTAPRAQTWRLCLARCWPHSRCLCRSERSAWSARSAVPCVANPAATATATAAAAAAAAVQGRQQRNSEIDRPVNTTTTTQRGHFLPHRYSRHALSS